MQPKLLAFTTDVISFSRLNVCLVESLEKIKEKGLENLLDFTHPYKNEDYSSLLLKYLNNGTNNFDLGGNVILPFYEETDEIRFNRFNRIWSNFTNPCATFQKTKTYVISVTYKGFSTVSQSLKAPGMDIYPNLLKTIPNIFHSSLTSEKLYEDCTKYSNKEYEIKFYTKLE